MFGSSLDEVAGWAGGPGSAYPGQWGVFPRAVMELLGRGRGKRARLTANIIEIYFGQFFDLLNEKKEVPLTLASYDGSLDGVRQMDVRGPADVAKIIGRATLVCNEFLNVNRKSTHGQHS